MKITKPTDTTDQPTAPLSSEAPVSPEMEAVPQPTAAAPAPAVDPRLIAATRERFSTGTHETVSQSKLVLMCFERIARDLRQAQESMTDGRHFDAHTNLVHAQDIVAVLRDALDIDAFDGGAGLAAVYDWSISQLSFANARKDASTVGAVASSLAEIGDAFEQAVRSSRPLVEPAVTSDPAGQPAVGLSVRA